MSNNQVETTPEVKDSQLDLETAETAPKVTVSKSKKEIKIEKACLTAIKNLAIGQIFWVLFILAAGLGAAAVLYLQQELRSLEKIKALIFEYSSWKLESMMAVGLFIIFLILGLTRINANVTAVKRLSERKRYSNKLPKESNNFIRETYFFYCRRRCVHFWLSFTFGGLFALCILYCLVAMGIDALVQWGEPKHVKLYDIEKWKDINDWLPAHKWFSIGVVGFVLSFVQFFLFRDNYRKTIYSFEEKYGRERIVDECLYSSRMWKLNFRYKAFAFICLCLIGCLFYLLFKRLLCVIFDKSFVF